MKTIARNSGVSALFLVIVGCASPWGGGRYDGPVQCAPYARQVTGLDLRGTAASWWWQARGHYWRSHRPYPGAVLVFRATHRVPDGHVSVVRRLISERRILVDHANWVPGVIEHNVLVEDVSPAANWTQVRVWWAPSHVLGRRIYATYGFILPRR